MVVRHFEERLLGVYDLDVDDGIHRYGGVVLCDDLLFGDVHHLCTELQLHDLVYKRADEVESRVEDADEFPEPHVDGLFVRLYDLHSAEHADDDRKDDDDRQYDQNF